MAVRREFPRLREKFGDDGLLDLHAMLDAHGREWKTDVLETATDRFERRLTEEISSVRVDLAAMRVSILRWMFAFWVAQLGAMLTINWMIFTSPGCCSPSTGRRIEEDDRCAATAYWEAVVETSILIALVALPACDRRSRLLCASSRSIRRLATRSSIAFLTAS